MKKRLLKLTALCVTVAMVAGSVAGCGCGKSNEDTLYASVLSEEVSESGSATAENTITADVESNNDNSSESNQDTGDKGAVGHTETKGTNGNLGASTGSSKSESTSKGTGSSSGGSKKSESNTGTTTDKTQTNTTTSNTGTGNSAGSSSSSNTNTGSNTNSGSSTGSSVNTDNGSTSGSSSSSSSSGEAAHTHNWVEVTEDQLEWVVDVEAWTEDIYEYRTICKGCGADITGFAVEHSAEFKHAYMSKKVVVDTVSHPEEGHYETKSVVTGFKCECGAIL